MQRHKQPLEFLESPYQGSKRHNSPVLAARRPFLAPSVFVEELKDKWVSPQFQDGGATSPHKKTKRRTRKQKPSSKIKETESKENPTVFPRLNFVCETETSYQEKKAKVPKSRTRTILKDKEQNETEKTSKNDTYFLFSLGSPRTPTIPGKVLVKETPEEQIGVRNWTKRLRPKKVHV